jgi:pimeloyl-ACP methyl ester carboxylesterase
MQMALHLPDFITDLIIADVAPVSYNPFSVFMEYIQLMKRITELNPKTRKQADEFLMEFIPQYGLRQFILTNLITNPDKLDSYKWRVNIPTIEYSLETLRIFPSTMADHEPVPFTKPTIFIGGERSDYIQDKHLPTIQKLFPNSVVKKIPNAGHWVHSEQPDQYVDLVTQFWKSTSL